MEGVFFCGGLIPGRTLSVAYGDSSPEGRALGRTGRFRPHRSTAGKSLPLSCKLSALAKASPFRERWHGEAVTERVSSGRTLSVSLRSTALPKGEPLAEPAGFVLTGQRQEKALPLSCKLYAFAKASPFRERWHGEAVTERVSFGTNPLSRLRRQLSRRASPWQNRQVSSSPVTGQKKPVVKL